MSPCEKLEARIEGFKSDLDGASTKERLDLAKAHKKEVDAIAFSDDHPAHTARSIYANALKHLAEALEDIVEDEEYKKKFGEESTTADNHKNYLKDVGKSLGEGRRRIATSCKE